MISVIITTFEQAASLETLLYCLRAQDVHEPFEVLICDDGSSFESFATVQSNRELSALDLRYIWQSKRGHRAARSKNNGIRCAMGDILIFLDGDILVKPNFLEQHRSAHRASKQIVCNPRRWVFGPESRFLNLGNTQRSDDTRALLSEFVSLAKHDMSRLFELLERLSIDVDRSEQQKLFLSNSPWMACIGFSLSVGKNADVYFDENFEGWGPEDREFTLRLVRNHGYSVSFRQDINVFHLEDCSTGRPPFSLLPKSPANILSFIRNVFYFISLYPDEDLSYFKSLLMMYHLDPTQQYWEFRPEAFRRKKHSSPDLASKVHWIEEWLRARSLLK